MAGDIQQICRVNNIPFMNMVCQQMAPVKAGRIFLHLCVANPGDTGNFEIAEREEEKSVKRL